MNHFFIVIVFVVGVALGYFLGASGALVYADERVEKAIICMETVANPFVCRYETGLIK